MACAVYPGGKVEKVYACAEFARILVMYLLLSRGLGVLVDHAWSWKMATQEWVLQMYMFDYSRTPILYLCDATDGVLSVFLFSFADRGRFILTLPPIPTL